MKSYTIVTMLTKQQGNIASSLAADCRDRHAVYYGKDTILAGSSFVFLSADSPNANEVAATYHLLEAETKEDLEAMNKRKRTNLDWIDDK